MTAIRPNTSVTFTLPLLHALLPALSPVLETIPCNPSILQLSESLTLSKTDTGLIVWLGINPIAWIYPGYHQGQLCNEPKRCDFVDVAYHRQTSYGINLETADFNTLSEALEFIAEVFSPERAA